MHGGEIAIASEGADRGTAARIDLPLLVDAARPEIARASAPAPAAQARRLLLVEDNLDSATTLAEYLELCGYTVRIARSVQEALACTDELDEIDAVISDIGLPDGTGHEVMRALRARRPLPGIALSGYGTSDDVRASTDAGFARHLVKPVEPNELLRVLQELTAVR